MFRRSASPQHNNGIQRTRNKLVSHARLVAGGSSRRAAEAKR
jgi:hypothetical protein